MSRKRINVNKKNQKMIAKQRINKLFELADRNALSDRLFFSDKYVKLARKISMRYLVKIPREHRRKFCKHCYSYLLPPLTSRIRIHRGKVIIYCNNCKKYTRIPLKNH
jgi:ribonuclease P protein subunit RPR2